MPRPRHALRRLAAALCPCDAHLGHAIDQATASPLAGHTTPGTQGSDPRQGSPA